MKVYYLIALCAIGISTLGHSAIAGPSKEAKLTITPENDEPIKVHLKEVKTYLANGNVPMWIIQNGVLRQLDFGKVLLDLGHFTTYQDAETSSAAVYFHKQQQFEGTIDIRYVIRELSIPNNLNTRNNIDQQNEEIVENNKAVFERFGWGHSRKTGVDEINWTVPRVSFEWSGKELFIGNAPTDISCVHHREIFYIETLVIINYDFAKELLMEYHQGLVSVISYLLTLFNSVDMLFSKLHSPRIKINIAGIIIVNDAESLKLARCYENVEKFNRKVGALNVLCVDESISSFLFKNEKIIPQDSFDITIFMSRLPIFEYEYEKKTETEKVVHLAGYTAYPSKGIFESRKRHKASHATIFVEDFAFFGSIAVIAHEMVHAFGIGHDNPIEMKNGICSEKLMKACNGFCQHCLDWSDATKILLEEVFRSPDGCIYKNKPRSLYPPGPRQMLTANEQCQCYIRESSVLSRKSYLNSFFGWILGYCNARLQCRDKEKKIHDVPVPMDGTPCDEHETSKKVCWNGSCTKIENGMTVEILEPNIQ